MRVDCIYNLSKMAIVVFLFNVVSACDIEDDSKRVLEVAVSEVATKNITDKNSFYVDNRLDKSKIEAELRPLSEKELNLKIDQLWSGFIDSDGFSDRRIDNRIKLNRLNENIESSSKDDYIEKAANDLLSTNYLSLMAHQALADLYAKNGNEESYSYHIKIINSIVSKIEAGGDGSVYSPYPVLTLSQIESYISVKKWILEGQVLYRRSDNQALVDVVYSNRTNGGPSGELGKAVFTPLSVDKLESEVLTKVSLSDKFLFYYIYSELALFDDAAKMGLVAYMNDNDSFFAKKFYEALVEALKKQNNLYVFTETSRLYIDFSISEKNKDIKLELLNKAKAELVSGIEKGFYDALYMLARIEINKSYIGKGNYQNYIKYLTESNELGGASASYDLYREYLRKKNLSKKELLDIAAMIKESFDRGISLAAVDYSSFEYRYGEITGKLPENKLQLINKAIAIGDRKSILYRSKILYENKSRTDKDIHDAKLLFEKLLGDDMSMSEINELAWVYATDDSGVIHDNAKAIEIIRRLYNNFKEDYYNSALLDTIAKVSELNGDYCNAIKVQKKGLSKSKSKTSAAYQSMLKNLSIYNKKYTEKNGHPPLESILCEKSMFELASKKYNIRALGYRKGIYTGEVENNMANGKGAFYWDDGDYYKGQFTDNNQNGFGAYWWGDKSKWKNSKYEGFYEKGARNGYGMYVWSNGDMYLGEHKANSHTGKGLTIYSNDSRYRGEFVNGRQHGVGRYDANDGYSYQGEFNNDMIHGVGTSVSSLGNVYIGAFSKNNMHGEGAYTWFSGSSYVGQFVEGEMHGKGICDFNKGEFSCGFKNGEHVSGELSDVK